MDGFIRTRLLEIHMDRGDVGQFLPNGTLQIIDRVKNIFKLSQGEYLAPEKIEQMIANRFIQQSVVHGDSLESFAVAIITPEPEAVLDWQVFWQVSYLFRAKENGLGSLAYEDLLNSSKLKKFLIDLIASTGKAAGLFGFEIPRDIHLTSTVMTPENGLLTPTLKTKRHVIRKVYETEIDRMYKRK